MIGTIRKHQTWLWGIIITVTIGSFVALGPTNVRMGNIFAYIFGQSKSQLGTLAGQAITPEELNGARNEVMLDYFLKHQQWPNPNSNDVLRESYWRLMLIQKQKEFGVQVSPSAAAAFARRFIPANPAAIDQFVDTILKPEGLDLNDFDNYLHHQVGLEQLATTVGVSGKLVTPGEAETMYRLEHRQMESSIVLFSASNYLASVTISPGTLGEFYTNEMVNYRVPDHVKVNYVVFPATNFSTQAAALLTNLDKTVDAEVQHMGTNLYHGARTPAESREAIRSEIVRQTELMQARKAAGVFAESLDEEKEHNTAVFAKLAMTNNLTVMSTEPFDRDYGPKDIKLPPAFAKKAFTLSAEDAFGGPIIGDEAVYVMVLANREPSRMPPFKEVEPKVTEDFRYTKAYQLAQQTAVKFAGTVSNGLAMGKSFSYLCAQAGVRSQALPLLTLDTASLPPALEEHVTLDMLKKVAFGTPAGKSSLPAAAQDGAFLVYVEKLLPVDEVKMKADMPSYLASVRQMRQYDAFQQWFNSQARQDPEFVQRVSQIGQEPQLKSSKAPSPKS